VLETPRLVLTSWLASDVDDLLDVHSDPETMRFVRHGRPESRDEVAALIAEYLEQDELTGVTKWRLADRSGRLLGRAGFGSHTADGTPGHELGYTIRRDQWGQGIATEIAAALVDWHRRHAGDTPLWATVVMDNHASARVLTKVGFEPADTVDHHGRECLHFRLP